MKYCYDYPRPALTVDAVLFDKAEEGEEPRVLLIRRKNPPFQGKWAFPGGFVDMEETVEEAVVRELAEETGVELKGLEQLATFSQVDRDPRGRVVSVVFTKEVDRRDHSVGGADDAEAAQWFPLSDLPELAFDHDRVLSEARKKHGL